MKSTASTLPRDELVAFCERWDITELSLFESAVRGELEPDSDLDFLVSFAPDQAVSLLDMAKMERELSALCGREVELVSRRAVETSDNDRRREAVLSAAQPIVQRSSDAVRS